MPERPARPRRERRARVLHRLYQVLKITLATLLVALGLLASGLLALKLPSVRALAIRQTNSALAGLFTGKLEIERAAYLGLDGARGVDANLRDAAGRRVLVLRGMSAKINVPRLLYQLVAGKNPLEVRIAEVELNDGQIFLVDDGTGSPTLASAFSPAKPTPPEPAGKSGGTRVIVDAIRFEHVWAHGGLPALPVIDTDLAKLQAAFRLDTDRVAVELGHVHVVARALPMGMDPQGELEARARLPIGPESDAHSLERALKVHFNGQLLASPSELRAELAGQDLTASFSTALSPAGAVRLGLAPRAWQLEAEGQGKLPDLRFGARASAARSVLELKGDAHVAQPITASLDARGRGIDLAEVLPDGPSSALAFASHASARGAPDGSWSGHYDFTLEPGRVADNGLPELELAGSFDKGPESAPLRVLAQGELREPGAPTELELSLRAGEQLTAELASHTRLQGSPRLQHVGVAARGTLDTRSELDLGRRSLGVTCNAQLGSVVASGVQAARATLRASARGQLANPVLSAELVASDVRVQGREFSRAEARALGPLAALRVTGTARGDRDLSLEWGATLKLVGGLRVRDVRLGVARGKLIENASVAELDVSHGIGLEHAVLDGSVGHVELSLRARQHLERLELSARGVDAARLRELLKLDLPVHSGSATLDARYDASAGGRGFLRGDVQDLTIGRLRRVSVHADASLERRTARGTVSADLGKAGRFTLTAGELVLPRQLARAQSFRELTGSVNAEGELDLAAVPELFVDPSVPIERASGHVSFELVAERTRDGGEPPRLKARVKTRELYVVGKRHEDAPLGNVKVASRAEPFTLRDMDVDLSVELQDGKLRMTTAFDDKRGVFATLLAETDLPGNLLERGARWQDLPIDAKLELPARELSSLPAPLRPASEAGVAALDVTVSGTFSDPTLRLKGTIQRFHDLDAPRGRSMDLRADVAYARTHGEVTLEARRAETRIGVLHGQWQGELAALSRLPLDGPSPVQASASLELADFPLGALPGAHALEIAGRLSGKVELADYGKDATVQADLSSDSLRVGTTRLGRCELKARAAGGELEAHALLRESRGELRLDSTGSLVWNRQIAPSAVQAKEGKLRARNFRVSAFAPLVQGTLNELDGTLDAELDATLEQGSPRVRGRARFAHGTIQLPQIGERFEDISFSAQLTPESVKVDDLVAHGTTGKLTARAAARTNGIQLLDADAHVNIRQSEKIPLTIEGQSIGDAWGNVDVSYRPGDAQRSAVLAVNVPRLHVELPENSPHSVIDLEPNEHVRTGVWREDRKFVTLPVQPLRKRSEAPAGPPMIVQIQLGNEVGVKKGTEADAQITGALRLVVGAESTASGQLTLRGGTIDVSGKEFKVESGTISFDSGELSNPTVVATARWDSPVEYRVYADYTGEVQSGKLTLHAEPPLTQDQIFSLIMFGTPDGSFGSSGSSGGTAGTAIGVAGGTATAGLNRALAGFTKLDISTRIDTSTGSARPEIVVQLSPRIAARVTRAIGEPNPGEPPDRTFLTLDFRLKARWGLSTLVGDHGQSEVDLIWRKRY